MEATGIVSPLKYVLLFVSLIIAQVLLCNNILLFGVAVPFVFIYFILVLPLNVNLNLLMSLSFMMGFLVDLFTDTLGLNCLACLLLSVLRLPVFYLYMPREDKFLNVVPSISSMGWFNYFKYILTLSAVYCLIVFGVELFSFASAGRIFLMAGASTVFTVILLISVDAIFNHGRAS